MAKPLLLIVGGPNGAGKTTTMKKLIELYGLDPGRLNADDRTQELRKLYPDKPLHELNLMAARQIDADVERNIEEGKTVFIETVLSSDKYIDDVIKAKERGYTVALVYVSVHPPEVLLQRVKLRAHKGGHDVDPEKIRERYDKSHKQLEVFGFLVDTFLILDNSAVNMPPILLAAKLAGREVGMEIEHYIKGANPAVDRTLAVLQNNKSPPSP
jgi:predicted ABC-type ATPase